MPRPRFSIAGMLGLVGVLGIAFAAIRSGSAAWAGVCTSVAFFLMLGSLLGVAFRRGERRVFWIGFALLGWGHLVLSFTSWYQVAGQYLAGEDLARMLHYEILHPTEPIYLREGGSPGGMMAPGAGMGGGFRSMFGGGGPGGPVAWSANVMDVRRIGRSLEVLVWAYLGGWLARYFASGRRPSEPRAVVSPSPRATADQAGP